MKDKDYESRFVRLEARVEHLEQEPDALASTTPQASAATVDEVLARSRVRLGHEAGPVSYAKICRIRGHDVAHLVLRPAGGPVTVRSSMRPPRACWPRWNGCRH